MARSSTAPESHVVSKGPCPHCPSSDGYTTYSDGHGYCYVCNAYDRSVNDQEGDDAQFRPSKARPEVLPFGEYRYLKARNISEETCKRYGYFVSEYSGKGVQVAPYHSPRGGPVLAQKLRFGDPKGFTVVGSLKECGLFGQHLYRDKGKMLVITEGEIDALTVSQLMPGWPVVSVPNGAAGARKSLAAHLEWLLGFDAVILFFDDDEAGQKAVEECATLFPPGRCKFAKVPGYKDANAAHLAQQSKAVVGAVWDAKVWRPDGIVGGADLWDAYVAEQDDVTASIPFPWDALNKETMGMRQGELIMLTAGSGIGKSAMAREIAVNLLDQGETVGMLMLEESVGRTVTGLVGIAMNKPLHLDETTWRDLPDDERTSRREAFERIGGCSRLHLYDHFGSTDADNLINRIRFMVQALGCRWIVLDHLSIVVSGIEDGDERKTIDLIMTKLRMLVQETKCGMLVISHLRRPKGDEGHEGGAEVSLAQLRGSHSIAQLSDTVIGGERNQQDEETRNVMTLRVLKCRMTGFTGVAGHLLYERTTGRLREISRESLAKEAKDEARNANFNPEF